MYPSTLIKLRPETPWRIGPPSGARHEAGPVYHSDSLFSAVTLAMGTLGWMEEWLSATAQAGESSAVRFSSCFPFLDDLLLIVPPRNLWPPPPSTRVRWKAARFVPMFAVETLLKEERLREDEGWLVDSESGCLVPSGRGIRARAPYRVTLRHTAATDRFTGHSAEPVASACLEFTPGAGLWCAAVYAGDEARERWSPRVEACFRLLADSGFGGERSRGWGRAAAPEFAHGRFPNSLLRLPAPSAPKPAETAEGEAPPPPPPAPAETAYWLWSLFSPAPSDGIDWQRGAYSLVTRAGRVESPVRHGDEKKTARFVAEGSVLFAGAPLAGAAPDVAPDGFPHPVYRSGLALAVPIPWRVTV